MSQLDTLPIALFEYITEFLSGFDLFPLSQVSRSFYNELLAPDNPVWKSRLTVPAQRRPSNIARAQQRVVTWSSDARRISLKRRYVASLSFRFVGLPIGKAKGRGSAIAIHQGTFTRESSYDLWFALLPTTDSSEPCYKGGIILGAQSVECDVDRWADNHQQFIHVDTEGNLYASITDKKRVVATHLETGRWYHLALTYDQTMDETGTQRVYLDGKLIDELRGCYQHSEWRRLRFWQLGTGCISGGSMGQPTPDHCGWYGFNGLLDEFRHWSCALSDDQVSQLASGLSITEGQDGVKCIWSMKDSISIELVGPVSAVQSTRPLERVVLGVRQLFRCKSDIFV